MRTNLRPKSQLLRIDGGPSAPILRASFVVWRSPRPMSGSTIPRPPAVPAKRSGRALCLAFLLALVSVGCGGDIESRMAEVRALQNVGQFKGSIEELREILTVSPDLAEANYRLGLALVQTGESSRAVWPLQKASESSESSERLQVP